MVSVLTSDRVDRGFEARSGQTKHYAIGMCCFYAKHEALRRKIMCSKGATCFSAVCCFSESAL